MANQALSYTVATLVERLQLVKLLSADLAADNYYNYASASRLATAVITLLNDNLNDFLSLTFRESAVNADGWITAYDNDVDDYGDGDDAAGGDSVTEYRLAEKPKPNSLPPKAYASVVNAIRDNLNITSFQWDTAQMGVYDYIYMTKWYENRHNNYLVSADVEALMTVMKTLLTPIGGQSNDYNAEHDGVNHADAGKSETIVSPSVTPTTWPSDDMVLSGKAAIHTDIGVEDGDREPVVGGTASLTTLPVQPNQENALTVTDAIAAAVGYTEREPEAVTASPTNSIVRSSEESAFPVTVAFTGEDADREPEAVTASPTNPSRRPSEESAVPDDPNADAATLGDGRGPNALTAHEMDLTIEV